MVQLTALILAAGKGTRMKSALPKVVHRVGGKPMAAHVVAAAAAAGAGRTIAVVGFGAEEVRRELGDGLEYVIQSEQLGTGHAVLQAADKLAGYGGTVMVLCGDTPLLQAETLSALWRSHRHSGRSATVLTARMPDPSGYGRILRDTSGNVVRIVEQKDAKPAELAVDEINTGIYCFESEALFRALTGVGRSNAQGEYYLTDVIGAFVESGLAVGAVVADDHAETIGINSRDQMAAAENLLRRRTLARLMDGGVNVMDPASTFVDADVVIGSDTVIYPFTWIEGRTVIGSGCEIGPNTRLSNCRIGDRATLFFSYAHDCAVGDGATVGPYAHLRPGTDLAAGVKVGNFVEVKNSRVGKDSKIPHLSYVGDTDMGRRVNIGSGTITVNYDGKNKFRTVIGDEAFIGCNTNLVAPVSVGDGAYVAAGSTITKEVPAGSLGVARAPQKVIAGWVGRRREVKPEGGE